MASDIVIDYNLNFSFAKIKSIMAKTINLAYEGYWRERNFNGVPAYSGVYTFMECKLNSDDTVTLINILYIGKADNVKERVQKHDKLDVMKRSLSYGNELCINCAPVSGTDQDRAEAALIYKHKPPFNDQLKDWFNYDTTIISNSGRYSLLERLFTVIRTVKQTTRWY